ncbi:capsid assembly protein [Vibrio phage 1.244.A._10N.261.54.C3]|nr:capsid assembly protein [Vibrio phage 1.244.A._10N.261.54.C3]AUR98634.1 capsid assembly protein [Vibrio phage 1.255.O._10N.286.45.F1]
MKKTLRENVFGGFNNFGAIFSAPEVNKKTRKDEEKLLQDTDIVSLENDGVDTIVSVGGHASYTDHSVSADLTSQRDKIDEYMALSKHPEVEEAIDNIINDMVTVADDDDPVSVSLDKVDISDELKEQVRDEFRVVLGLMDFYERGYDRVKNWYITGRQACHMVVNDAKKSEGIQKIVILDPRAVRKMRSIKQERVGGIDKITSYEDFYLYDPNVIRQPEGGSRNFQVQKQALKIPTDAMAYVDSGEPQLIDGFVPSLLDNAIRAVNNLVTLEDATVIYAITRAPEKRAFYLDVGSLPKKSAEEYMNLMMGKFKTSVTYDRNTGKIDSGTSHMGIVQDYWLPRREGASATEIAPLQGGSALTQMMEPVLYHLEKVYRALKVPKGRINDGGGAINIGGSDMAETSREEHRFGKFVNRMQRRYATIFKEILRTQLILKNITTEEDWDRLFENHIKFDFESDTFIKEQQETQTRSERYAAMAMVEPYVGKMISIETVQRDILKWSDEDIAQEKKRIDAEKAAGLYPEPTTGEDGEIIPADGTPLKFSNGGGF